MDTPDYSHYIDQNCVNKNVFNFLLRPIFISTFVLLHGVRLKIMNHGSTSSATEPNELKKK